MVSDLLSVICRIHLHVVSSGPTPHFLSSSIPTLHDTPYSYAVVMGRGGLANHHAGNNSFRILTASMKPEYARLPKEEKTDVSRRLLDVVHARGGKFLAKDSVSGLFYEVENKTARRKCSQALREENKEERAARKRKVSEAQSEEDEDDGDEEEDGEGTI